MNNFLNRSFAQRTSRRGAELAETELGNEKDDDTSDLQTC